MKCGFLALCFMACVSVLLTLYIINSLKSTLPSANVTAFSHLFHITLQPKLTFRFMRHVTHRGKKQTRFAEIMRRLRNTVVFVCPGGKFPLRLQNYILATCAETLFVHVCRGVMNSTVCMFIRLADQF